ncbi:glycosyl transferase family 2 [Candidatus Pacearchaeota archaeon]|nr:glycosyl transferase family 2 [Candidatus Pacearchaeota archaeon]|tara:strand:- start:856 stop:1950 length:1095 start_codon:yes stop_codon:yes gene_type:complete
MVSKVEKDSKKKNPSVEIIVLTHNSKENIERCLLSLNKVKYSNFTVTVVDQNSEDGTGEMVKKKFGKVNLIRNEENKSFAAGNNDVLRKSKADYCLLLNDDTEVSPDFLAELVGEIKKDKRVAAVQPKVLDLKFKGKGEKFEYAAACGGFIDIYGYPVCRGRIFDNIEQDTGQYDDVREIFWASGVCILMRMSVVREIGKLDEIFGSYAEELDWCWRAQLAGYKIKIVPKSEIHHIGSGTWGREKLSREKEYLLQRNHLIILFKNYSLRTLMRVLPSRIMLELITFGAFGLKNPKKSLGSVRSGIWLLGNFPRLVKRNREVKKIRKVSDFHIRKRMINKSAALSYFLFRDRKKFSDFVGDISKY